MKKSKKIILSIICIISVLVISAVPCFADEIDLGGVGPNYYVNEARWSEESGIPLLDWINVVRMYTMGAESNVNLFKNTFGADSYILNGVNYKLSTSNIDGVNITSRVPPRIGFQFFFHSGAIDSEDLAPRFSNTYLSESTGVYVIDFDLELVESTWKSFLNVGDDYYFNGYELAYSSEPYIQKKDAFSSDYYHSPVEFLPKSIYKNSYETSFTYVRRGSAPAKGHLYHVRIIAPLRSFTTRFNVSVSLPSLLGYDLNNYPTVTVRMDNLNLGWYPTPYDIPGYVHIPDFDNSFDGIKDTEDYFNDNLNDSLNEFKDIGTEMTSFLRGDLLSGFAVWNQYFTDIIDIDPIRKLLIFSLVIGIFTFLVSASNLVVGVASSIPRNVDKVVGLKQYSVNSANRNSYYKSRSEFYKARSSDYKARASYYKSRTKR